MIALTRCLAPVRTVAKGSWATVLRS